MTQAETRLPQSPLIPPVPPSCKMFYYVNWKHELSLAFDLGDEYIRVEDASYSERLIIASVAYMAWMDGPDKDQKDAPRFARAWFDWSQQRTQPQ